jgi:hypothetical protein
MSKDIIVTNKLDRPVFVLVSPNDSWLYPDVFVSAASMTFTGYSALSTIDEVWSVLKIINLSRQPLGLLNNCEKFFKRNTFFIPQRNTRRVNEFDEANPLNWISPSGWAGIFGGATVSLLFVDFEKGSTVKLNCETDCAWVVTEKGVRRAKDQDIMTEDPAKGLAFWNGGSSFAGDKIRSNAAPAFARLGDKIFLFYRDGNSGSRGNGLLYATYNKGKFSHKGYLHHDVGGGVAPLVIGDAGVMIFNQKVEGSTLEFGEYLWDAEREILFKGQSMSLAHQIKWRPSVAHMNGITCVVTNDYPGNALMWDVLYHSTQFTHEFGNTMAETGKETAVIAFKGKFHVYFTAMGSDGKQGTRFLYHAESTDGKNWGNLVDTKLRTSRGVAVCEYKGKLVVVYRDAGKAGDETGRANGVFYAFSDDGFNFTKPADPYFGLDIDSSPTCIVDGDSIIVLGIQAATAELAVTFDLMWAILEPVELL